MSTLTRWVLAHKRTVVVSWLVLTIAGMAAAGPATNALEPEFSVPGKEGWETNVTGVLLEALIGGFGALLVLIFVFASFLTLVPLLMAVISIVTCFVPLLLLTEVTDVSPLVQFVIVLIGLGIAIDYSLLVVSRWREERSHGAAGDEAILRAMETSSRAVVFSGITVAIGLLALIALPLPFLRSMGYGGMLIPLVSVAVAVTLLPVVVAKLGSRLDWPHRRSDDKASRAWTRPAPTYASAASPPRTPTSSMRSTAASR